MGTRFSPLGMFLCRRCMGEKTPEHFAPNEKGRLRDCIDCQVPLIRKNAAKYMQQLGNLFRYEDTVLYWKGKAK
jgi:hypothetical protein